MKSAVHFGAGNIGRGFIGLLLRESGYRVTFVDVQTPLVDAIEKLGRYTVRLADDEGTTIPVNHIRALPGQYLAAVAAAVATSDLVTTAVGPSVLPHIAPAIVEGLAWRREGADKLPVIACENLIGNSQILREHIAALWKEDTALDERAIFPNCAVDRIVPAQTPDPAEPLTVIVEPFCEWVIDATPFAGMQRPPLVGALFVDDLTPYIERKLFTVNTGHCCAAYLGYRAGHAHIHEAMADNAIASVVKKALQESGAGLVARHHFDAVAHAAYIEKILQRFSNPLLPDEVTRVGRTPIRKLGSSERLVAPARLAEQIGMEPINLAQAIAAAFHFDFADDPEAVTLQSYIRDHGIAVAVSHFTEISPETSLHAAILSHY